ncbi:MAG: hypothetical protein J6D30_00170 [Clostridia bacterium]|nr:hypothetical protein [Clostridia bacterium]
MKKILLSLLVLLIGTAMLFNGVINSVVVFAETASSTQIETDTHFSELHQQTRLYHTSEES